MSDTITAPATGTVLATDDIGGTHYPRAKLSLGADGTAVDAVGGAGAVGAGVQRMTLASDDPAVALLGQIVGYVDGLEALLATLNGYVDGLETLIGSGNTLATSLNGYVDGIEGLIGTTNSALTTLQGFVDGLEGLAAAPIPAGSNLIGKVDIDASLKSGTATPTTPGMTTTSTAVFASNTSRRGAVVLNPNVAALKLNLAGGNAASAYHKRLQQYEEYEIPAGYTGLVTGALESGAGSVNAVEYT